MGSEKKTQQEGANHRLYAIHALTPLHVGSGKGIDFIDLPIMREKVAGWPYIPGSTIKGKIRANFVQNKKIEENLIKIAFGSSNESDNDSGNAGSIVFSDARILCFPIRSLNGTFAYISSPLVLNSLLRDLTAIQIDISLKNLSEIVINDSVGYCEKDSINIFKENEKSLIVLEDLDFVPENSPEIEAWSKWIAEFIYPADIKWQTEFRKRFIILTDNHFNFFCHTATQIDAHIRIDPEKKITRDGALWYEESLPAETILSGIVWCDQIYSKGSLSKEITPQRLLDTIIPIDQIQTIQLGGKLSTGKGLLRFISK
jgi:CRISPR-associated protein Cmr4